MFSTLSNATGTAARPSIQPIPPRGLPLSKERNTLGDVATDRIHELRVSTLFTFARRTPPIRASEPGPGRKIPRASLLRECRSSSSASCNLVLCLRRRVAPRRAGIRRSFRYVRPVFSTPRGVCRIAETFADGKFAAVANIHQRRVYRSDVYSFRNSDWASLCDCIGIPVI